MKDEPIRVLIVDDSMVVVVLLTRILSAPGTGIQVIGNARDGADALEKIPKLSPQVICTDLNMPGMNGLEFIRNVMSYFPRPILVLSSAVEKGKHDDNIFKLLEAGALDVMPKPQGNISGDLTEMGKELITKIKILSGVTTFTRHSRQQYAANPANMTNPTKVTKFGLPIITIPTNAKIITIGASTGGPHALQTILTKLSPKLSIPVVCVQHVTEGFTEDLVDWLGTTCPLTVRTARIGELLSGGTVYFPPDAKHLLIDKNGRCATTTAGMLVPKHRPSITLAFNSIAQYYHSATIGVLLTGMGSDGADGLLNIRKAGGLTIAQDELTSVVFGMPKVAAEIGACQHVLPLIQISDFLATAQ